MRTLYRLLRAGMHTVLLFVLPWLTGALVSMVFDVQEVSETKGRFATIFSLVIVPLLVFQLAAIAVKVGREIRMRRAEGVRGGHIVIDAIDRHVRVLTPRGLGMAVISLIMVAMALAWKWGQFGVLAVAGLGIMYIASTAATITSAFAVRAFDDRVRRGRGAIDREMSPTVVDAGDAVEERFVLARVPVPAFFRLHIEEQLPIRLGGDTRFALDRSISRQEVTVTAPLPRTPRGLYKLGPAEIWYEDVLGLTRVYVASRATASLRALPRLRNVVFARNPRSLTKAEGPLSMLSPRPTEEHFRTRQYAPGDDLRRVHWKQSINTGSLIVRVPESVPYAPSRVRLVLDSYLPPGWRIASETGGLARAPEALDDVLDLLVEAWVGLASTLLKRGEAVSLVTAYRNGSEMLVREVVCKRGEERKWRSIGSDVTWQHEFPLDRIVRTIPKQPPGHGGKPASTIMLSSGLYLGSITQGSSYVVADGSSVILDPPGDPLGRVKKFFLFDYPVGADDNRINFKKLFSPKPPTPEKLRLELSRAANAAVDQARICAAPVLVVRKQGLNLSLEAP